MRLAYRSFVAAHGRALAVDARTGRIIRRAPSRLKAPQRPEG